eukprot:gene61161-83653_t
MGIGKSTVPNFFRSVLGHNVTICLRDDKAISGEFNGPLMGK